MIAFSSTLLITPMTRIATLSACFFGVFGPPARDRATKTEKHRFSVSPEKCKNSRKLENAPPNPQFLSNFPNFQLVFPIFWGGPKPTFILLYMSYVGGKPLSSKWGEGWQDWERKQRACPHRMSNNFGDRHIKQGGPEYIKIAHRHSLVGPPAPRVAAPKELYLVRCGKCPQP